MSSLTVSRPLPFGQRRRMHPALRLGAATLGSLVVIAAGWDFLADTVGYAAASAPAPRTDRQVWYVPTTRGAAPASDLDIARSVAVVGEVKPASTPDFGAYTHKVGVEALKVRSGPKRDSEQLFNLRGGALVAPGQSRFGWVEITTEDGRSGGVFAKFLNLRQN